MADGVPVRGVSELVLEVVDLAAAEAFRDRLIRGRRPWQIVLRG